MFYVHADHFDEMRLLAAVLTMPLSTRVGPSRVYWPNTVRVLTPSKENRNELIGIDRNEAARGQLFASLLKTKKRA